MAVDNYRKLQQYLDSFGLGFPPTKSGVELRVLQELFSEEEAEMFLNLKLTPESPQEVAERLKRDPVSLAAFLERMTKDGLLFSDGTGSEKKYMAAPFFVGIYENKARMLTRDVAQLFEDYLTEHFGNAFVETLRATSFLRVVPMGQAVEVLHTVSSYDRNREFIQSKDRIAMVKCICRSQKGGIGKACEKPTETCMAFDDYADYLVENNHGRAVSREEALAIQDECEEKGMVSLGSNISDRGILLCHCCGCCCMPITYAKKLPRPNAVFVSNFYATVKSDVCTGCEACVERCPMEAVSIDENGAAVIDYDRCIGCGVCVPACPTDALALAQKPKAEVPIDSLEADKRMEQARERARLLVS